MWIERLQVEHENLRAALGSASEREGNPRAGLRLAGALYPFWTTVGYFSEGRGWLSRFLNAVPAGEMADVRAKALNAAGSMAHVQDDNDSARALLEECLAIRRALEDRRGVSVALKNLGDVLNMLGETAAARALLEESLAITREIGYRWGVGRVLMSLAPLVLAQGEVGPARALAQECVDIERQLGGQEEGVAVAVLSEVMIEEGDAEAAMSLCSEALAKPMKKVNLNLLEVVACAQAALGHATAAGMIWGHSERVRQESGICVERFDRLRQRAMLSPLAALEGDAEFAAAWRRGAAMTTEEVIELVLQPGETPPPRGSPA